MTHMTSALDHLNGMLTAIAIAVGRRACVSVNLYHTAYSSLNLVDVLGRGELQQVQIAPVSISRNEFLSIVWQATTDLMTWANPSVIQDFQWHIEESIGIIATDQTLSIHFHPLFDCPLFKAQGTCMTDPTVLLMGFDTSTLVLVISTSHC